VTDVLAHGAADPAGAIIVYFVAMFARVAAVRSPAWRTVANRCRPDGAPPYWRRDSAFDASLYLGERYRYVARCNGHAKARSCLEAGW
jgi:hypothetical protein